MEREKDDESPAPAREVEDVRERILRGATRIRIFADAIDKSERQVRNYIRAGLPCVHIGRDTYPLVEEGGEWLRTRKRSDHPEPAPRAVGRPRKAAA